MYLDLKLVGGQKEAFFYACPPHCFLQYSSKTSFVKIIDGNERKKKRKKKGKKKEKKRLS
jgi:hypothetical protein